MSKNVAVVTFGRFNPPTLGHKVVLDTMVEAGKIAAQSSDTKAVSLFVVPSPSKDKQKNPLGIDYRKKVLDQVTDANIHVGIDGKEPRTIIEVAVALYEKGYTDLIVVVGTDRVTSFQDLLDRYNGNPDQKGNLLYDFGDVTVVQAGDARSGAAEVDADADVSLSDISATAARTAAQNNDFSTFKSIFIAPDDEKLAREVFKEVQSGMGVVAESEPEEDGAVQPTQDELEEGVRSIREALRSSHVSATNSGFRILENVVENTEEDPGESDEGDVLSSTSNCVREYKISFGNATARLSLDLKEASAVITDISMRFPSELKSSLQESSEDTPYVYNSVAHVLSMCASKALKEGFNDVRLDVYRGESDPIFNKAYLSRGVVFREAIRQMPRELSSHLDVYVI